MTRVFFTLFLCSLFHFAQAQVTLSAEEIAYFNSKQDSLSKLVRRSITAKTDADKLEINAAFSKLLDEVLSTDRSALFTFDSLRTFKMLQSSPDNELHVITWTVPLENKNPVFFGYIQHMDPKTNKWELFKLEDKTEAIKNSETSNLDADKWMGAYYFNIIEILYKKKTYYTLLGWGGNYRLTQRKVIDVLTFNTSGQPQFSEGSFEVHKVTGRTDKDLLVWQKRVVFEFKKGLTMSLRYDPDRGLIIYDHLSPEESSLRGQYQYYGPDLSLDAYRFKKGKWLYIKDAEGKNAKVKGDKKWNKPPKDPNAPPKDTNAPH